MPNVQKALLPAIVIGILMMLMATRLISNPRVVLAANPQNPALTEKKQPARTPAPGSNPAVAIDPNGTPVPVVDPVFVNVTLEPHASDAGSGDCPLGLSFDANVRQWCGLITEYAQKNGLEPGLVAALITQESGGDPGAYSGSGAVGLMQVMPSDGLAASFMCASGPCFTNRPSSDELRDPEFNIAYGTKMLSELVQKYGSVREALKNYGPINVGYYYADLVLGIFNNNQ